MNTRARRKIEMFVAVAIATPIVVFGVFVIQEWRSKHSGKPPAVVVSTSTYSGRTASAPGAGERVDPPVKPGDDKVPPPVTATTKPKPVKAIPAADLTAVELTDAVHDYLGGLTDFVAPTASDAADLADLMSSSDHPDSATLILLSESLCETSYLAEVADKAAFAAAQPVARSQFAATSAKLATAADQLKAFCKDYGMTTTNAAALASVQEGFLPYVATLHDLATALTGDYAALTKSGDWGEVQPAYEEALRLLP